MRKRVGAHQAHPYDGVWHSGRNAFNRLERAIGLERLSLLAAVTIGGLMVSTFLTLLYVPIFYTLFKDGINWLSVTIIKLRSRPRATPEEGVASTGE